MLANASRDQKHHMILYLLLRLKLFSISEFVKGTYSLGRDRASPRERKGVYRDTLTR